ncbi:MAG TPA: HEAT repeat domain-containing protein, partial [Bdellovibrionota bacterium]|nr:HEAT repeat domain-containing protein [Bdellovibrionota bacterium]
AFPEDTTAVAFLTDEASSTKKSVIRVAAVQALGESQGEKVLEELGDYLKHPDPQTRFAAAKAIDRIGTEKSRSVLDEYLPGEKAAWIGARIKAERAPVPVEAPAGLEGLGAGDWVGEWKGHWIEPGPRPREDLRSVPVTFKIAQAEAALQGEVTLTEPGAQARRLQIQPGPVSAKGRWAGRISRVGKAGEKIPSYAFDALLEKQAGRWVVLFRIPDLSVTAILGRR